MVAESVPLARKLKESMLTTKASLTAKPVERERVVVVARCSPSPWPVPEAVETRG